MSPGPVAYWVACSWQLYYWVAFLFVFWLSWKGPSTRPWWRELGDSLALAALGFVVLPLIIWRYRRKHHRAA